MVQFTGNTYADEDIAVGVYDAAHDYSGVQQTGIPTTYAFTGSVTTIGDMVSVVVTTNGISAPPVAYIYEGYYEIGATAIYVFSTSPYAGAALAISSTGGPVPSQSAIPLTTGGTIPVCFLRGTRIATISGDVAVEDLLVGDRVVTRRGDDMIADTVIWVGRRRVRVTAGPGAIERFPVRIRADALRDGVPSRDLLVTQEHCLLVGERLIPARMLVNGSSIVVDTGITDYECYHVELDHHAILIAEGMEAESYLDTGNRAGFLDGDVPAFRPDLAVRAEKSWAAHAAAPLATARREVEPIWNALAVRAGALGMKAEVARAVVVDEPDLHLETGDGLRIDPSLFDGRVYAFVVPRHACGLRLKSRRARPSETIGPFVDDRRDLGVKVGRIAVSQGRRRIGSDAHLTRPALPGWHETEGGCRWTSGDAMLPIDPGPAEGGPLFLDIEVVAAGPYRLAAGTDAA
jgi:antigen 43